MELVNKKYIKLDKFDVYGRLVKSTGKEEYSANLIRLMFDFEKEKKYFIREFYLDKNSKKINKLIDVNNLPIKRDIIRNAIIFAILSNNFDIAEKLKKFLFEIQVYPYELGDLLDYVLENSIDINEYYNGEMTKIIYNENLNEIEQGYIYQEKKDRLIKILEKNL